MDKKRSRVDIIGDILDAIITKGGEIRPTHLMYKSNLAHGQMQNYLEELVDKQFVQRIRRKEREYITITEQGYKFAQKIHEMKTFERGFGL